MNTLTSLIETNNAGLLIFIGIISIISILIMVLNLFLYRKIERRYKNMMTGMDGKNLEEILEANLKNTSKIFSKTLEIESEYKGIRRMAEKSLQNVGIVRFNAFDNTGSDLSFAIALLDNKGDGVVLSGLFGRDETRTYAKPVSDGKSTYHLSEEEMQALTIALGKK